MNTTRLTFHDVQLIVNTIPEPVLLAATLLCAGSDNTEYVRGVAELLIDTNQGITMENKESLMRFLVLDIPLTYDAK